MISLSIVNFILIDNHKFTINNGLTSVTGETGAGKSIVFEAIRFLSGQRSGVSIIKKGKEFSEISATVSLDDFPQLQEFVDELDLHVEDQEIFLRRKINSQGKSTAFINNVKINISKLKVIGEKLFVIVGQHDAHLLSNADYQLSLIDSFGTHQDKIDLVSKAYNSVKLTQKLLQEAEKKQVDLSSEKQLLEYQVAELEKLSPKDGEYPELEKEYKILSNATELSTAYLNASNMISGNKGVITNLKGAIVELGRFSDIEEASNIIKILENSKLDLEEASNDSSYLGNSITFEPDRYKFLEDKIGTYYALGKRLGVPPTSLHLKELELVEKLNDISSIDIDSIKIQLERDKANYYSCSSALSKIRNKVTKDFSKEINVILENLKMRKDSFSVQMETLDKISRKGTDKVTFMLQSNAESDIAPLVISASGGELSRITLAINTINSTAINLKRFHMFDEIDTGVSGETAGYIGDLLKKMALSYPVICITHIPHVAGMANQQLHVVKKDTLDKTITSLVELNEDERKKVIAILLFGNNYNNEQLKQAEVLIAA
jgi:DNA repair protein RecN (Recombination protein N)